MMQTAQPQFRFPPPGKATKWILGLTLGASVIFSLTQRQFGFGVVNLAYSVPEILNLEVWRLASYPFVMNRPFGLIIMLVLIWLFGGTFEGRWGTRDFVRFFAWSSLGAGLVAIPLYFVVNLIFPFKDVGIAMGPGPAIDAMLVSLAITMPNSNVLFGFVLPIRARTIVWIILGFQLLQGLMTGAASLSITLGGMAMGYLLTTGKWRPSRWMPRSKGKKKQSRRGLHIVPPKNERDDTPTLH